MPAVRRRKPKGHYFPELSFAAGVAPTASLKAAGADGRPVTRPGWRIRNYAWGRSQPEGKIRARLVGPSLMPTQVGGGGAWARRRSASRKNLRRGIRRSPLIFARPRWPPGSDDSSGIAIAVFVARLLAAAWFPEPRASIVVSRPGSFWPTQFALFPYR